MDTNAPEEQPESIPISIRDPLPITNRRVSYIDIVLAQFSMQESKKGSLPFRHKVTLSKDQCPKTSDQIERMKTFPYTRLDIAMSNLQFSRADSFISSAHERGSTPSRQSSKNCCPEIYSPLPSPISPRWLILLRNHLDGLYFYGLGSYCIYFKLIGQTLKARLLVYYPNRRSIKQICIVDSTMEAAYVAASEAANEAIWLRNFLIDLGVVPTSRSVMTLYYDNNEAVANSKEPRAHNKGKHIERKYHIIRHFISRRDVVVTKISSEDKLVDPFIKSHLVKTFNKHVDGVGLRCIAMCL
ncbi:hypothetical protein ACP275_06G147100 [Erythranthe tilingii]